MLKLLYNAQIRTMNAACPRAEAAVTGEDGRFAFAGTHEDALLFLHGRPHKAIDAGGNSVVPGLNDSHLHFLHEAMRGLHVNLRGAASIAEMQTRLRDGLAARPGEWLVGEGWNQEQFAERRLPTREDLDAVSRDVPIYTSRACGHIGTMNSRALEIAGLSTDGDGILREDELDLVARHIPEHGADTLLAALLGAQDGLYAKGITSIQTDDLGSVPFAQWGKYLRGVRDAGDAGALHVRYALQALTGDLAGMRAFFGEGLHQLSGSRFRVACMKLIGDGSLGARTAWLRTPYEDAPGTCGIGIYSDAEMRQLVREAAAHGMPVAIHAIGDAAMEQALSAIAQEGKSLRHAIVHAQIASAEQTMRCGAMGLVIMAQPIFLEADIPVIESRVGAERAHTSYRWRAMQGAGAHVAFGTDCPVEPYDPMPNLYCAITRHGLTHHTPYLPAEAFTLDDALYAYTAAGAYASAEEHEKGKIAPGQWADYVIFDRRLNEKEPASLLETGVLATVIGGETVYSK